MTKKSFNFSFINLGCNKNLVDTQHLLGKIFDLWANNPNYDINYITEPYDKETDYVFLNTCWFIKAGRDEMFKVIDKLTKKWKKIYLLWCALQYFKNIAPKDPEFKNKKNIFNLSRNDFEKITISDLIKWYNSSKFQWFKFAEIPRAYTNAEYGFEYLKISEWCDNKCTFCIIPKIRGKQRSLPIEKILNEVQNMINAWISEIILIAQDSTQYWTDLYGKPSLFKLLTEIEKIKWKFKYRLLYLYPDIITIKELRKLKTLKKFIPYFDIPLQHISSNILKRMWRFYDEKWIYKLLNFIKLEFPKWYIRTNFIIWFPWETDSSQQELIDLINWDYFDNIALFEYHDEPFATSSKLPNKITDSIIRKRFTQIRQLVNKKLMEKEDKRKWKKFEGYIMDYYDDELVIRPELHCPEIDAYDEISPDQIIKGTIDIWEKITYQL